MVALSVYVLVEKTGQMMVVCWALRSVVSLAERSVEKTVLQSAGWLADVMESTTVVR